MLSKTAFYLTISTIKMYFRDKRALMFTLFVPIMIMSIFGLLDFSKGDKVNLGVVVPEELKVEITPIIDGFKQNTNLNVYEGSTDGERTQLENDKRSIVLIFEAVSPSQEEMSSYVQSWLSGGVSNSTTQCTILNQGQSVPSQDFLDCLAQEYVSQNLRINVKALINSSSAQTAQFTLLAIKQSFTEISLDKARITPLFDVNEEQVNVHHLTQLDFILPGMIGLTIMQTGLFAVAGAIVSYKEKGILKRLFATPLSKIDFLFSNILTRILIGLIQIGILFLYPKVANLIIAAVKDIPPENAQFYFSVVGNIVNLLIVSFVGNIVFISIGFAISSFAKTFDQVQPVIMIIQFPMMFFSGVFFPKSALPSIIQKVADYLPLTFLVDGMRYIMNNGKGINEIGFELLGLFIYGLVSFFIALKVFKWE